jgi:hypothetical protein
MRIKLSEKNPIEREEICDKIIYILDLDENKSFVLCELDNNIKNRIKF